ncbi:MAG: SAM-dependent methyltransferase [Candidatus Magasanikbacteria bacterium]|nr:SAM-dependent methyltransferase [Candidatus Magasanikbacteria bacterium]
MHEYSILKTKPGNDYALLDSGDGEKLERYGEVTVARPDPQALWKKRLSESEWQKADAYFRSENGGDRSRPVPTATWQTRKKLPERWPVDLAGFKLWIKLSAFKHTGVFPEQVGNWEWIGEKIKKTRKQENKARPLPDLPFAKGRGNATSSTAGEEAGGGLVRVLNLFGYTGGASLAAAKAGAEVVHVDGSKVAIGWARDNAMLSGLENKPIRWILDDARAYVKREVKRGNKYDGIIMDPPAFGHGAKGELWKVEDHFLELLDVCKQVLSDQPLFFLINGYASGYSAISYKNNLADLMKEYKGEIEIGELTIAEKGSERLLPAGIFARWSKE